MSQVLDASALLALLHTEPGSEYVEQALDGALISTVNWAEVVQKSLSRKVDVSFLRNGFTELGVIFVPFTPVQAETTAHLWEKTKQYGLSLADRSCLALAMERNIPVLTTDKIWRKLDLSIDIKLVR